jgi:hypothetical protein
LSAGRAIGSGDATSLFASFPGNFLGETIDDTTIVTRYTILGDANLDQVVDTIDFNLLAANFGLANRSFTEGDFSFDETTDTIDFNVLASKFSQSLSAPSANAKAPLAPPAPSAQKSGFSSTMRIGEPDEELILG